MVGDGGELEALDGFVLGDGGRQVRLLQRKSPGLLANNVYQST
jgi:hypothetical protein